MILEELVLHNFGPYEGRQTIKLAPRDPSRPVVLIGGLNGAGKTTLLDGLHLALYGHRAHCSKRGRDGYYSFLRRSIHQGKARCTDAAVELQFRHRSEGLEHTYRVVRTWRQTSSSASETVEVFVDGKFEQGATDRWAELAEEFLPVGVASLFLFDGEKIQDLADVERSSEIIRTAIHGLLGLDIVRQLDNDLRVLERRKRGEANSDNEDVQAVVEAEKELAQLEKQAEQLLADRASAANDLTLAKKKLATLDAVYEREGGKLFEEEKNLKSFRASIVMRLNQVQQALREDAQSILPLLLVAPRLTKIRDADAQAERLRQAASLTSALEERDKSILNYLAERAEDGVIKQLAKFLASDRRNRSDNGELDARPHFGLGDTGRLSLGRLCDGELDDFAGSLRDKIEEADRVQVELDEIDRKLAAVPDEASLHETVVSRREAEKAVHQAEGKLRHLDEERARALREVETVQGRVIRLKKDWSKSKHAAEGTSRVILYSEKVRDTLAAFAEEVVKKHLIRIESLVVESFRLLLRKQGLIGRIQIDPSTYRVTLLDGHGQEVHADKLSAGERQLFAVAMLWGLARSSGRPLPAVIDTPLGRLDSDHRRNVVNHYFPQASHQVLLLSTDEEIGKEQYQALERSLAHTYTLEHDDVKNATHVREGYAFAWS